MTQGQEASQLHVAFTLLRLISANRFTLLLLQTEATVYEIVEETLRQQNFEIRRPVSLAAHSVAQMRRMGAGDLQDKMRYLVWIVTLPEGFAQGVAGSPAHGVIVRDSAPGHRHCFKHVRLDSARLHQGDVDSEWPHFVVERLGISGQGG